MKENKNKSYVLYIKDVEAFENYKIPNVELMEIKKFTDKQSANIIKGDIFLLSRQYNKKLWKMLKKIYAKQFKIASICIDSSIANLSFELFDKKQNLHTFKVHTEDSVLDFKVFKTKKEIGRGSGTPFFFVDSFTGPGSYSGRGIMHSSQFENIFNAAREFGNRYAEANGDCSELLNPKVGKEGSDTASKKDARQIHTPIKIDKDKCTFKFNVGGFTEKDCSLSELADKIDEVKQGDNISATIKFAHYELEMSLINKIAEILNSDCSVTSSLVAKDKVAMILHEVEHYKFQKDFEGNEINGLSINPRNPEISKANKIKVVVTKLHKDDDKRAKYTPECSTPLADEEMASKTIEEVSEYLDNTEYDAIINNIKISISIKYMTEKIAGKHNIIIPKDFRERLFDLSYLPDLENRFKQFSNIGILQQELLLKSEDKDILEGIGELTFAQVLELFTVLADMKGMINIKDEESGEYCLKHLEKKAELIVNDIKMADITDIKISKTVDNETTATIEQELTEPAIEPNMDDLLAASDTDTMVVLKEEENDELVFILYPKEKDTYNIICKTKKELDSDENLNNYRVKFINNETQLFGLIKNDLLYINHTLNLTKEQINNVAKMYVPSHTVGLHYKITEDAYNNHTVDILFSYSQKSYDELYRTGLKYIAFKDFQDECKK